MTRFEIRIGAKVELLESICDVEKSTIGYIVEHYHKGIMVAWDLPSIPFPHHKGVRSVAKMMGIHPECPMRDGFAYDELYMLRLVK